MDSLYGGHAGVSFVLKASFKSVEAMETEFRKGASYRDVWYGEYCLIDTPNKNDKDNGKVYQRDVPSNNNASGAKYIGQIVGPSSGTPYFQMMEIDKIFEQVDGEDFDENTTYVRFPTGYDEAKNKYVTSNSKSDISKLYKRTFAAPSQGLVPGKKTDGTFNDSIRYTWLNIRKDNADADSWFYVGFEVPYLVEEFSASNVSPYSADGSLDSKRNVSVTRVDDQNHPYYGKWDIKIPHGIKGDTLRNLRVVAIQKSTETGNVVVDGYNAYPASQIYLPSAITKKPDGTVMVSSDASKRLSSVYTDANIDNNHSSHPLVLVLDFYAYDNNQNPTPYMIYVGDYNMIDDVIVANDGTVTVNYTNREQYRRDRLIKWVNAVSLNTSNGLFTMSFNNGTPDYTTTLEWVKNITIASNGLVHLDKTENSADLPEKLTWVKAASLDENTGNFSLSFNNNDKVANISKTLVWVRNLTVADNGDVSITKTDGQNQSGTSTKIATIKWVNSISLSDDGSLTFNFNTGSNTTFTGAIERVVSESVSGDGVITQTLNTKTNGVANTRTIKGISGNSNTDANGVFHLKAISSVGLNNSSVDSSGKVSVTYNWDKSSKVTQEIGSSLNFVADSTIRGNNYAGNDKDWHLLVLYSSPDKRPANGGTAKVQTLTTGSLQGTWVRGVYNSQGILDSTHWWKDFGSVKSESGVLVGLNITGTLSSNASIISELNQTYPYGLGFDANGNATNSDLTGKVVVYTKGDVPKMFAFDYTKDANGAYSKKWFFLGSVGESKSSDAILAPESGVPSVVDKVGEDGLVFSYESVAEASAYPDYWASTYAK